MLFWGAIGLFALLVIGALAGIVTMLVVGKGKG